MSAPGPNPGGPGAAPSASSSTRHPLRPYYQPDDDAAFMASAPRFSTAPIPSAGQNPPSSSAAGSSGRPPISGSARVGGGGAPAFPVSQPTNRYLLSSDSDDALSSAASPPIADVARALLVSGALQYTSTCLAMPFEVGKLLLQIQWVPRDDVWEAFTIQQGILEDGSGEELRRLGRRQRGVVDDDDEAADADADDAFARNELAPEAEEWQDERGAHRRDFDINEDELSDEDEAEAYFRDLSEQSRRPPLSVRRPGSRKPVDRSGYVMRRSIHEDGTRPEFVMPVVVQGGVWEMIKAVGRGKEGWLGLWKGAFTSFILDLCGSTIQPVVSSILSLFVPQALSPLPLPYAPYPRKTLGLLMASHLITGIILSPLDLVRTRLVAQSTLPPHRKYSGPFNALRTILREEGGWRTAYFHPNLFIPALLDHTLRPLLSLGAPLIIELSWRIDPNTSPISYALADFVLSTASLLITLPVETVRRRLQIQARAQWGARPETVHGSRTTTTRRSRGANDGGLFGTSAVARGGAGGAKVVGASQLLVSKPLRTCVETRPRPYAGVVEAIYRILTEETSVTPRPAAAIKKGVDKLRGAAHGAEASPGTQGQGHAREESSSDPLARSTILAKNGHSSLGGLRSLYRGFGMGVSANAVVFVLTLISGERSGVQTGWAEI